MTLTLLDLLFLFLTITLAFVAGQALTLLLFKPPAVLRKAKPVKPPAKAAPDAPAEKEQRTRGGNWFQGAIRR